jgi:hypothetical protein
MLFNGRSVAVMSGRLRLGVVLSVLWIVGIPICSPVLAKNVRWTCVYPGGVSPNGSFKEEFKLEFVFDDVTEKAVMIGNQGTPDVAFYAGPFGVTFMERLPTGAVQVTTIAKEGDSVHSRHTMMSDKKIIPTQYYGRCKVQ